MGAHVHDARHMAQPASQPATWADMTRSVEAQAGGRAGMPPARRVGTPAARWPGVSSAGWVGTPSAGWAGANPGETTALPEESGAREVPWGLVLALVAIVLAIVVAAGALVVLHVGSPVGQPLGASPSGSAAVAGSLATQGDRATLPQGTSDAAAVASAGPAIIGVGESGAPAAGGRDDAATRPLAPVVQERTYARVTLSAVGDNLMNMPVVYAADANAGEMNDGWYDFTPMYAGVADILASHDLNFIDIETILGGDHLGLTGYPSFNSPAVIAEQVAASGWNLATTATNHSWDMGLEGIQNSSATWAAQPSVLVTGTFTSPEDRATIRTVERGGMRFAFLAYTDYLNGLVLPDDQWWAVATADADAMSADVERARTEAGADVVIVAMSWGDENATAPNDAQYFYAQTLANLDVDLVIGFGPHVIQPIEWVEGLDANGTPTGHQTLVVYSLGNFLSNQPLAIENVEGCFTCTFERLGDEGPVSIVDPVWTPLVNHIDGDWHEVFKLRDYTPELAAAHDSIGLEADPLGYAYQLTQDIIGPSGVPIAA